MRMNWLITMEDKACIVMMQRHCFTKSEFIDSRGSDRIQEQNGQTPPRLRWREFVTVPTFIVVTSMFEVRTKCMNTSANLKNIPKIR